MAIKRSSLREALVEEKRKKCRFEILLKGMPKELREEVIDALRDPEHFATAAVVRQLEKRNITASRHDINECRNGCACEFFPAPVEQESDDSHG